MLDFRKFSDADIPLLKKYSEKIDTLCYEYKPSYASIWNDAEDIHIAEGGYGLYLRHDKSGSFLFPFSDEPEKAIGELIESERKVRITSIPAGYIKFIPSSFTVSRKRDLDDYIYSSHKLISLEGKKLSAKRNHIHQFEKTYDYSFCPLRKEDFDECLNIDKDWEKIQDASMYESIEEERKGIENCLNCWDDFEFSGAIIRIDGKAVAFTIGEKISDELAIIHFEKCDTSYLGIYAAINQHYISTHFENVTWINRQEDIGLEGLRRAKESYHPDMMGEKWMAQNEI